MRAVRGLSVVVRVVERREFWGVAGSCLRTQTNVMAATSFQEATCALHSVP